MELTAEEFKELCAYYRMDFNVLPDLYTNYVINIGSNYIAGKSVLVGLIPQITFPPSILINFSIDTPGEAMSRAGYFNMSRYLKVNLH